MQKECFEIRLESIGGLGANLCGKLLGELGALQLGLYSSNFSSYGSEKRGSAVRSFIRYSKKEIRITSPIERPDILGIFHEAMAEKTNALAGAGKETTIVINTDKKPEEIRDLLQIAGGRICCIDCQKIAMDTKSRVNMIMLGAIAKETGFIMIEQLKEVVEHTIGKKYPHLLEANLAGVKKGFKEGKVLDVEEDGKYEYRAYEEIKSIWGYETAPAGGVNPWIGSTVSNDLSASREGYVPLYIPDRCIHCGLCDSTCPDMVFQFVPGEYKGRSRMINLGPDYTHCKGCLRCVQVCPVNALVQGVEREQKELVSIPNKDLLTHKIRYEETGSNGWITGESYLTEQRVDGGVV